MSVQVLSPPWRPLPWDFDFQRVDPRWRHYWNNAISGGIFWQRGLSSRSGRDLVNGASLEQWRKDGSSGNTFGWAAHTPLGPSIQVNENNTRNGEAFAFPHLGDVFFGLDRFTACCYFRYTGTTDESDEDSIMGQLSSLQGGLNSDARRWLARYDSLNSEFDFILVNDSGTPTIETLGTATPKDGQFHLLVVRADGGTQHIFLDYEKSSGLSYSGTIGTSAQGKYPELMGGHNVTRDPSFGDSPRAECQMWLWSFDVWPDSMIYDLASDRFGPFRPARRVAVVVPAGGSLVAPPRAARNTLLRM